MEKTEVKPGKVFQSAASRWCREDEAPFNTVLGIPGAVFLFCGEVPTGNSFPTWAIDARPLGSLDWSLFSARLRCRKLYECHGYRSTGRYFPLGVRMGKNPVGRGFPDAPLIAPLSGQKILLIPSPGGKVDRRRRDGRGTAKSETQEEASADAKSVDYRPHSSSVTFGDSFLMDVRLPPAIGYFDSLRDAPPREKLKKEGLDPLTFQWYHGIKL